MKNAFNVKLKEGVSWNDANFYVFSAWGTGNSNKNMWGWGGTGEMSVSSPQYDKTEKYYYITVSIKNPLPVTNEKIAFISRYALNDKQNTHGVIGATLN